MNGFPTPYAGAIRQAPAAPIARPGVTRANGPIDLPVPGHRAVAPALVAPASDAAMPPGRPLVMRTVEIPAPVGPERPATRSGSAGSYQYQFGPFISLWELYSDNLVCTSDESIARMLRRDSWRPTGDFQRLLRHLDR
jgi:hypothetical protein